VLPYLFHVCGSSSYQLCFERECGWWGVFFESGVDDGFEQLKVINSIDLNLEMELAIINVTETVIVNGTAGCQRFLCHVACRR
jgi:hypothetical protein